MQHHAVVVPLSLSYMKEGMTFFINGVICNALIHSFMYWSYYQQSKNISVPWKKHLTKMQMVQFLWGMLTFVPYPSLCGHSYLQPYVRFGTKSVSSTYLFHNPIFSFVIRTGTTFVWLFHQLVLVSFLGLFMQFFNKRYKPDYAVNGARKKLE
jgi:hypothetical protein